MLKKSRLKKIILSTLSVLTILASTIVPTKAVFADDEPGSNGLFAVAPMNQMITLTPGEIYEGNFHIVNPANNLYTFYYTLEVKPFMTANDNSISFDDRTIYNQIVDWIELSETEGHVEPNENTEVRFSIHVPEDAPAGGQYATIVVRSEEYYIDNSNFDLAEVYTTSHLIYADVAGETIRKGKFDNVSVLSFLFSGNITGSASITNEGNVHSQATHTLQVFPLFSNEEIYTNEEDPKKSWIMPGNTTFSSVSWGDTPNIGIFHVIYNAEFEGVESTVDKIVIVCPLWLLLIIIFVIILLIFRIVWGGKKKEK